MFFVKRGVKYPEGVAEKGLGKKEDPRRHPPSGRVSRSKRTWTLGGAEEAAKRLPHKDQSQL